MTSEYDLYEGSHDLIHFTWEPLSVDDLEPADQSEDTGMGKPAGIWFSVGEAWLDFGGESRMFAKVGYDRAYRLTLADDADLVHLSSKGDIFRFTDDFRLDLLEEYERLPGGANITYDLDWHAVADLWSGIVVVPYISTARLDPSVNWYYSWDIASACIWDVSVIGALEPVEANLDKVATM